MVTFKGFLILALLGGWIANTTSAAGETADPSAAQGGDAVYAEHSDEALTALAAEWDTLDVHQRRALLTEMRRRMAGQGGGSADVIHIRTERRYGRIIQQADGSVIRIETQVVQVRPVSEETLMRQPGGFGVGFERRVRGVPIPAGTHDQIDPPAVSGQAVSDDPSRQTPSAASPSP